MRRAQRWFCWLPLLLTGCAGDGAGPEEETISRDTFIETYVALREVGLGAPNQIPSVNDRLDVLEEHGVSEQDLLQFVEVRGRNVDYMRDVWNEVETRIEALRTQPDSGDSRS